MADEAATKELSASELEVLQDVFKTFDADGGGSIDVDEMHLAMKALGAETTKSEIKKLVNEIDADGNGEVDFDEFVTMMKKKMTGDMDDAAGYEAFKAFDSTKTGLLEQADLKHVLEKMGEAVTPQELEALIKEMDVDGDGRCVNIRGQVPAKPTPPSGNSILTPDCFVALAGSRLTSFNPFWHKPSELSWHKREGDKWCKKRCFACETPRVNRTRVHDVIQRSAICSTIVYSCLAMIFCTISADGRLIGALYFDDEGPILSKASGLHFRQHVHSQSLIPGVQQCVTHARLPPQAGLALSTAFFYSTFCLALAAARCSNQKSTA
eukprot:SAG31_NODE_7114_length_1783_cov_1.268090_1_plen_324_part_00